MRKKTELAGGASEPRVAADLRYRAAQLVALVDANVDSGRDTRWLSDMLDRLLKESDSEGGGGAVKKGSRGAGAASLWTPRKILSALIEHMVAALTTLGNRKVALTSLEGGGMETGRSGASSSAHVGSEGYTTPKTGSGEEDASRSLYQRELVAIVAALHTCAHALPSALAPHLRVLAPLLRGDPVLSAARNAGLQAHVAGIVELAVALARDVPPSVLVGVECDLVDLVREGVTPAVMQSGAAALGVITAAVTGNDTRVRVLLAGMLESLDRLKCAFVEVARGKAAKGGGPPPTVDQEAVVWLRDFLAHVAGAKAAGLAAGPAGFDATLAAAAAAKAQLQSTMRALYGCGMLAKYCDLDGTGGAGRAAMPVARVDDDDDEMAEEEHEEIDEDLDASSELTDSSDEATPVARKALAPVAPAGAGDAAEEHEHVDEDGLVGWSGKSRPGKAAGKPLKAQYSAKRARPASSAASAGGKEADPTPAQAHELSTSTSKQGAKGRGRGEAAKAEADTRTPKPPKAASIASLPTIAKGPVLSRADDKTEASLPRGGTMSRVHSTLYAYAWAALKLSGASRSTIHKSALALRAAGARMSTTEATETRRQMQSAQSLLRDFTAVGWNAVRGLGLVFSRSPGLAMSESGRTLLHSVLGSPLAPLKEAGLAVLSDLLSAQDERHAVARALGERCLQDARTVTALLAAGGRPSRQLLHSAAGGALQAAVLHSAPKTNISASSGAVGTPVHGVGGSDSSSAAAEAGGVSGRVQLVRADGTVVAGRTNVLGATATDSTTAMLTSVVQEHWDDALQLMAYAPSAEDVAVGVAEAKDGQMVRAAAAALLALVAKAGVRGPDDTLPLLMCMATDEPAIADVAHPHLLHIAEAYPSQVERGAVTGLIATFGHQLDVFGSASAREIPQMEDEEGDDTALPPGVPLLGRFWTYCICRNPSMDADAALNRGRLPVLRSIVNRVVPDTIYGLHGMAGSGAGVRASHAPGSSGASGGGVLAALGLQSNTQGMKRVEAMASKTSYTGVLGAQVDVVLARYLCSTLAALPYERDEDVLTIASYVNRAAVVHADALLASLRRYIPAGKAGAADDAVAAIMDGDAGTGLGHPLPQPGTPPYTSVAAHAGFAYSLACLLRTKAYLKDIHKVPDSKVMAFDPMALAAARLPERVLDPVEVSVDVDLPDLQPGFAAAVAAAIAAATPAPHSSSASGRPRVVLTPAMLEHVAKALDAALIDTAGDFQDNLAGIAFRRRPKVKKSTEGAVPGAGAGGQAEEKKKKKKKTGEKRLRGEDGDGDFHDDEYGASRKKAATASAAVPARSSGRAARGQVNYAEMVGTQGSANADDE